MPVASTGRDVARIEKRSSRPRRQEQDQSLKEQLEVSLQTVAKPRVLTLISPKLTAEPIKCSIALDIAVLEAHCISVEPQCLIWT